MSEIFYHYTTGEGAEGIADTLVIRKSTSRGRGSGDDARFGEGVYLTKIAPTRKKAFIAWNNYDGRNREAIRRHIREGKLHLVRRDN